MAPEGLLVDHSTVFYFFKYQLSYLVLGSPTIKIIIIINIKILLFLNNMYIFKS